MSNNINYENLVRYLVSNINLFAVNPMIVLTETDKEISIEIKLKNKTKIIKEMTRTTIDNVSWRRLYFNIFSNLINDLNEK